MPLYDTRPQFHVRSPVQPGRDPTRLLLAVAAAAGLVIAGEYYWMQKRAADYRLCLAHEGLSRSHAAGGATAPTGNTAGLIGGDDYPPSALDHNEQGATFVRLDVSPKGWVRGCSLIASSGSKTLDSATCRILKERACFLPARDASGAPVEGSYMQRVVWRIAD